MDKYTVEVNYERTYWSAYKELDFNYDSEIQPALRDSFDKAKPRKWKDTDTFRVGVSAEVTKGVTLMAGYAKDESPVQKKYLSYELPDTDANIYSVGVRVESNENLSWGLAYLHDEKDDITLKAGENVSGISGTFSNGGADLVALSMQYKF